MEPIRVVLADDHPLIRAGIRNILHKTSDIKVVGEADNGYEALDLVYSLSPDVLLLDMEMPGMKGVEVAEELENTGSPVPILVLSAYEEKQFIIAVLATGAAGYLTKEEAPEKIIQAVRGIANGETGWVSPRISQLINEWKRSTWGEDQEVNQ
jgi:two-component system, NarL family, invasion response regulator UvrY